MCTHNDWLTPSGKAANKKTKNNGNSVVLRLSLEKEMKKLRDDKNARIWKHLNLQPLITRSELYYGNTSSPKSDVNHLQRCLSSSSCLEAALLDNTKF